MSARSVWMLFAVALLIVIPLVIGGTFEGADGKAAAVIEGTDGFVRWFYPIWEPPSGEVASLFFSLQAAFGALVIGYVIGRSQGRREGAAQKDGHH